MNNIACGVAKTWAQAAATTIHNTVKALCYAYAVLCHGHQRHNGHNTDNTDAFTVIGFYTHPYLLLLTASLIA